MSAAPMVRDADVVPTLCDEVGTRGQALTAGPPAALTGCAAGRPLCRGADPGPPRRPPSRLRSASWTIVSLLAACSPPPDAEPQALAFFDALVAGELTSAASRCDAQLQRSLPPAQLESLWRSLLDRHGLYAGRVVVEVVPTLSAARVHVRADFERAEVDMMIVVNSASRIAAVLVKPDGVPKAVSAPAPPIGVRESEITIAGLPATLAQPVGGGPHPLAVLLHDAGAGDRDGVIGGAAPLRQLARQLAAHGIATLRWDKRARTAPDAPGTLEQELADAAAVVAAAGGLGAESVWIAGFGLGGHLAPAVAQRARPAGVVVIGGPARPLVEVLRDRLEQQLRLGGMSAVEQAEAASLAFQAQKIELGAYKGSDILLGLPGSFWKGLDAYEPPAALAALELPALVALGELDTLTSGTDQERWREALRELPASRLMFVPSTDHVGLAEEQLVARAVAELVLER